MENKINKQGEEKKKELCTQHQTSQVTSHLTGVTGTDSV